MVIMENGQNVEIGRTIFIENGTETSTYDRLNNVGYSDVLNKLKKYGIIGE